MWLPWKGAQSGVDVVIGSRGMAVHMGLWPLGAASQMISVKHSSPCPIVNRPTAHRAAPGANGSVVQFTIHESGGNIWNTTDRSGALLSAHVQRV